MTSDFYLFIKIIEKLTFDFVYFCEGQKTSKHEFRESKRSTFGDVASALASVFASTTEANN